MPLSLVKKLNLGELTPTTLPFQMEYRSLTYPLGLLEDVLVKVDKFIFLVDFVVLDMEEDKDAPNHSWKAIFGHRSSFNRCEAWRISLMSRRR